MDSVMSRCIAVLDDFDIVSKQEFIKMIYSMNKKKTYALDPSPTKPLFSQLDAIVDLLLHIVNLSLTTGVFPSESI